MNRHIQEAQQTPWRIKKKHIMIILLKLKDKNKNLKQQEWLTIYKEFTMSKSAL